jgi:hypothetical protein
MSSLNLSEITKQITPKIAQLEDNNIAEYIKSTIVMLEAQGKDITDYTLVKVNNPMQMIDNNLQVTSQWRIIEISKVENIQVYDD